MRFEGLWLLVSTIALAGGLTLAACSGSEQPPRGEFQQASQAREQGPSELAPVPLNEDEKLLVVATTTIVADVVSQVGDDKIELTGLLPAGTDPHAYEATPQDLRTVADAHIIFASGAGLGAFLDEMIKNAVGDAPVGDAPVGDAPVGDAPVGDAPVVHVSRGIEFLEAGNSDDGQTEPAEEPGHEDEHGEVDPHTWFDPNNVIIWTDNIEQALSALDPANTVAYEANAQTYKRKLEELDAWIREQVAQIPAENRMLVTDHHVLSYFADEYGFEQVGAVIGAFSTIAEPSARELAALEDRIRQHGVPAVFVSSTVNPKVAARVAQDTGIELAPLYTGSLSKPSGDASTYLDFMRYNVRAIVSALR